MTKVMNKDTKMTSLCCFGVFIVNFEHVSRLSLLFLLLTLNICFLGPVGRKKYIQFQMTLRRLLLMLILTYGSFGKRKAWLENDVLLQLNISCYQKMN